MSKQSFRDLKETIELKDGEIDELTMELESKKEEINKLKLYSTKLKYQKENLEYKLDNEISNEKAKIKELDDLIENAVIIDESKIDDSVAGIGSTVKVLQNGNEIEYSIVGSNEADPFENKISDLSPIGKALLRQPLCPREHP